jgi:hypothetical protein
METLKRILFGDIVDPIEQLRDAMYSALLGAVLTFVAGLVAYYGGVTGEPSAEAGLVGLAAFFAGLRRR